MNAMTDYEAIEQTQPPLLGCQILLSLGGFPIREYGFQVRHDAPVNQLVDQLAGQDQTGNRLLIVGHADDSDSEETNDRIARLRAAEVLSQLRSRLQQRGLNMPMDYEGRGSTEPVATGGGGADHEMNRRVEVLYCPDEPVAIDDSYPAALGWRRFWRPGWARRASMLRWPGLAGPDRPAFPRSTARMYAFPRPVWRGAGVGRHPGPTAPMHGFPRPVRQGAGVGRHPGLTAPMHRFPRPVRQGAGVGRHPTTPISLSRPVQQVPRQGVPRPRSTYSTPRRMAAPRRFGGRGRR